MGFHKGCEGCGRSIDIDHQICPKCGFDFKLHPRISPKCPYCEKELHIYDFFIVEVDKKNRKSIRGFLGESAGLAMAMFHCPFCGKILGFSDSRSG